MHEHSASDWSTSAAPWLDGLDSVDPETDLANAHRISHHCGDRLRWSQGWQTYAYGEWRDDEAGALGMAAQLCAWIKGEAAMMEEAGAPAGDVAVRRAWAVQSQTCAGIDAALRLARALLSRLARPVSGLPVDASPTHREQCLAAVLAAIAESDDGVRAASSGRLKATALQRRVSELAPKLWPGLGEPPLSIDQMERLYSAALSGDITGGAARAARKSSARN